ncbi:hypothetical protein F1559_000447 [Cyanidiococcus yangmingshanensis]|uniref:Bromo domain-containing protein n=1 Tax=Cyanidiococcus yangmingshanensis TaxID=2690220 RepID=A0A7J7ICX0_9RHOD|nr:hypothetical protein F1559_000447 [Cyanidiococcus yangmingshanensis]
MVLTETATKLDSYVEKRKQLDEEYLELLTKITALESDQVAYWKKFREEARERINHVILSIEEALRDEELAYIDQKATAELNDPARLVIRRVPRSLPVEQRPANATLLSRPANTGVDFTRIPPTNDYRRRIKQPVFLNHIRERARKNMYASLDAFLEDMRLMRDNTRAYNQDPAEDWVCQHAELLLEAAEERARECSAEVVEYEKQAAEADAKLKELEVHVQLRERMLRPHLHPNTDIEVFYAPLRAWMGCTILRFDEGTGLYEVFFPETQSSEMLNLERGGTRWRPARVGVPVPNGSTHERTGADGARPRSGGAFAAASTQRTGEVQTTQSATSHPTGAGAGGVSSRRRPQHSGPAAAGEEVSGFAAASGGRSARAAARTASLPVPSVTQADLQALKTEILARIDALSATILGKLDSYAEILATTTTATKRSDVRRR